MHQRQAQRFKLVERPLVDYAPGVHGCLGLQQDKFAVLFGDGLVLNAVRHDQELAGFDLLRRDPGAGVVASARDERPPRRPGAQNAHTYLPVFGDALRFHVTTRT